MTKRGEIDNPESCLNKGHDGTLKFVLTESDITMPDTIRDWVSRRLGCGKNQIGDLQITEALRLAQAVEDKHKSGVRNG